MTFKEREQITKKNSDDLLSQLIYYQGEKLISEILRLGIQSLMGKEFSPTSISRFSTTLDAELDCWRERVFTREYLYVVADARYESCHVDGRIIDIACLVALGIDSEGYRHVLGVDTSWSESNDSWDRFIGGLKSRGG